MLRGRSEPKGLIVTFPDGTVFSSDRDSENQTEVWVKTTLKMLSEFGVNRFMDADLKTRKPGSKPRFLSTDPTLKNTGTRQKTTTKYKENSTTYYIFHDYNAGQKKDYLESISDALGAGLKVDVL